MKRVLRASLASCFLTALLLMTMRLPSDSGFVGFLKRVSTNLLLPGTYFGFIFAGGRIDDISFGIADFVNFLLYTMLIYILLIAWDRRKAKV